MGFNASCQSQTVLVTLLPGAMKLIVVAALFSVTNAGNCPNECSGRGTCNHWGQCTCYQNGDFVHAAWTGADCSEMTCPPGKSFSQSSGFYDHVADVECSDAGLCDRETGECKCFAGYDGSACQRTSCPNSCSGHGQCRSNEDFALDFSEAVSAQQENIVSHNQHYYDFFRAQYTGAWDSGKNYGCLCDVGYRGADCSLVECPSNEDPLDEETCEKYDAWYTSGNAGTGNAILIGDWAASDKTHYNPIRFVLLGATRSVRACDACEASAPPHDDAADDATVALPATNAPCCNW